MYKHHSASARNQVIEVVMIEGNLGSMARYAMSRLDDIGVAAEFTIVSDTCTVVTDIGEFSFKHDDSLAYIETCIATL